jgi:hypothetical protein
MERLVEAAPDRQISLNDPDARVMATSGKGIRPLMSSSSRSTILRQAQDEESQIQALARTQAPLPMKPGHPTTRTHKCKRHGTTTLFAALDVLEGKVIGR